MLAKTDGPVDRSGFVLYDRLAGLLAEVGQQTMDRWRRTAYQLCGRSWEMTVMSEGLAVAAASGDVGKVDRLLREGANINGRNKMGTTPLMWAVAYGNCDVVGRLLARGAEINAVNASGLTALHLSIASGRETLVQQLITAGANIHTRSASGETPLMRARARRLTRIGAILENAGAAE
jgi:ankyrin repeat protein